MFISVFWVCIALKKKKKSIIPILLQFQALLLLTFIIDVIPSYFSPFLLNPMPHLYPTPPTSFLCSIPLPPLFHPFISISHLFLIPINPPLPYLSLFSLLSHPSTSPLTSLSHPSPIRILSDYNHHGFRSSVVRICFFRPPRICYGCSSLLYNSIHGKRIGFVGEN